MLMIVLMLSDWLNDSKNTNFLNLDELALTYTREITGSCLLLRNNYVIKTKFVDGNNLLNCAKRTIFSRMQWNMPLNHVILNLLKNLPAGS